MRIIGIDPALTKTGWGIIDVKGNAFKCLGSGTIKTDGKAPLANRLHQMHQELLQVISLYKPQECAIEETFINTNPLSSLKLGHARGALILTAGLCSLPIFEYSSTAIKKATTGVGRAQKQQIQAMIKILLPQSQAKTEDEADALATAICHANNKKF